MVSNAESRAQPPTPDTPPRHEYTSFSSLLKNSPKGQGAGTGPGSGSGSDGSPQVKKKASREANEPGGGGWHLSSVREEPASMDAERSRSRGRGGNRDRTVAQGGGKEKKEKDHMGLWKMMALTVSMAGSQIAWTVELGLGTPYLLNLGLSEQLTSLVWLAGPISGLIAQPLIGAISDSSTSKYRRRYWIVAATILLVFSGLALAFTEPIAALIVDLLGGGQGDWDPKRRRYVQNTAIGIAVFAFYCLDFALNGLQSSLRNLLMDITPGEQLATANAWHGRFAHTGNIIGFALGFLNLQNVPIIRLVGGGQFRKVCILALVILVSTVWLTCWTQEEVENKSIFGERKSRFRDVISTIVEAVKHLPKPVRRVCLVQVFAFMGWFPYLFYSTTYVAEVMAQELNHQPDVDRATRAGSLALLIYSFVAIIAGTLLPYLAARDRRLLKPPTEKSRHGDEEDDEDDEHDAELERVREMVREWKAEAARDGRPLKLPTMPFMLRNIWTAGLVLFGMVMASTFFITKVWQATVAIALVGICWAIACWVPFAIIMEFLKELDDKRNKPDTSNQGRDQHNRNHGPSAGGAAARGRFPAHLSAGGNRPLHARAASTPVAAWQSMPNSPRVPTERSPLTRSYSTADIEELGEDMEYTGSGPVAGGTIMGIHNLAIVFPQFVVALVASLIFKLADGDDAAPIPGFASGGDEDIRAPKSGVAWVLRFGGLMALVGALICRKVPPTKTEKAMRRRLAEMREESEE